jgi:hypothetical protein
MTILAVIDQTPPPASSPEHPNLRADQPPRVERKSIVMGTRLVHYTGVTPTQAELDTFIAKEVAKGDRAEQAVSSMNRLILEMIFRLENQNRDLRARINQLLPNTYTNAETSQLQLAQFRQFLINRWRELNL